MEIDDEDEEKLLVAPQYGQHVARCHLGEPSTACGRKIEVRSPSTETVWCRYNIEIRQHEVNKEDCKNDSAEMTAKRSGVLRVVAKADLSSRSKPLVDPGTRPEESDQPVQLSLCTGGMSDADSIAGYIDEFVHSGLAAYQGNSSTCRRDCFAEAK